MRTNVHPDEAIVLVLDAAQRAFPAPVVEMIPLEKALGRALVKSAISPIDHPPFDKSAMDGYAHSRKRACNVYRVIDTVPAGRGSRVNLKEGEVIRIMTGAPIPEGADAVQRIEWTSEAGRDSEGRLLVKFTENENIDNIIRKGENLEKGNELLSPGILAPQDIGILAAGGFAEVGVAAVPKVAILSTGDEIEPPGRMLSGASIFDSNGPQLCAQTAAVGARPEFMGIIRDREAQLRDALSRALDGSDLVLVSGGVSMGDFDLVPSVLKGLGVETVFHSLAMRPGKPTFFGMRNRTAVFGLPGNPVSTFVNFEVLVKPYILKLMGLECKARHIAARLDEPLDRKVTDRVEFLPARLGAGKDGMHVAPLRYHGSSMITILAHADALLRMELGQGRIEAGGIVDARLIRA